MMMHTERLADVLAQVDDGRIQVPEFQRELVLTDDWVIGLLASVSLGYPVGALTFLEAGEPTTRFATAPLAGTASRTRDAERLLVDGRRRLTALHLALCRDGQVPTVDRGARRYLLDLNRARHPGVDRDQALLSVPATGDLSVPDGAVALHTVLAAAASSTTWPEAVAAFDRYELPTIVLARDTTRWTVRVHGGTDGRALSDRYRTG
jgi:hypothetical protein